ncbi:acetoacetate decarboxylase family protein [Kitasatospora sp. MBT63]|uniref:acetoacetate decarboxylase family protein n=1 Tax=Kitasatospora sp. MBT63 TaxID=1444768 RepID=UPI00068FC0FE|nr:acetoacetate decarboxylase family protein [Kitasatospora sp. MBT63]
MTTERPHPAPPPPQTAYPPAPWRLTGRMYGTALRLPADALPRELRPPAPVGRDGTRLLVAAWVSYDTSSVGPYREFMVCSVARLRPPVRGTVLKIWVDSRISQAGGRALWSIPKELADFTFAAGSTVEASASGDDGRLIARYTFVPARRIGLPAPLPLHVLQPTDRGGLRRSLFLLAGRPGTGSATLTVPEDSPVAFLRQARPVCHISLTRMRALVGLRSRLLDAGR